jgi:hypothetical protein
MRPFAGPSPDAQDLGVGVLKTPVRTRQADAFCDGLLGPNMSTSIPAHVFAERYGFAGAGGMTNLSR